MSFGACEVSLRRELLCQESHKVADDGAFLITANALHRSKISDPVVERGVDPSDSVALWQLVRELVAYAFIYPYHERQSPAVGWPSGV